MPANERTGRRPDVLRMLKETAGPLSIAEIAGRLGVHPNTVRFHLETLVENGQVQRVSAGRRAPGRPPQLFRVTPGMDPTGPRHYQMLAEALTDDLATRPDPSGQAAQAGRAWGYRQGTRAAAAGTGEPVARLLDLLDELGFAPELREDAIGLRHCPFLELATGRPEIICPLHLGLMQGAMRAWHSPATVDRLESFARPDLCLAHLTAA